ncbi:MAG: cytidylyltransferase domain-containing protein [Sphingomonas sp.]
MTTAVCTICARGGSKGVPNKNVRPLMGKPLIVHSIERALECDLFDGVAVSSDSPLILDIAQRAGATWLIRRPDALATDQAAKLPVIQHALLEAEVAAGKTFDVIVDLDATSPLRLCDDINGAYRLLLEAGSGNVITGAPARRSPYFNLVELDERGFAHLSKVSKTPIVRRQASPKCYDMNGSIYVWYRDALLAGTSALADNTRLYVMPEDRSIDIDSELDFRFVDFLLRERASAGLPA